MIPPEPHNPERLAKAGIPLRFQRKTLESYVADIPQQEEALAWATSFATLYRMLPRCGLLIGKPGTGKTHLAIGIALEAMLTEVVEEVCYTSVQKAVRRIKASWSGPENEEMARAALTAPRLLILDEIGVQFGTEFEQHLLFDVLNDRYENMKSTVLVSNLPLEDVTKYLGDRVIDRLREDGGKVFVFDWESHRKGGEC